MTKERRAEEIRRGYGVPVEDQRALLDALDAAERERDEARAEVERLRAALKAEEDYAQFCERFNDENPDAILPCGFCIGHEEAGRLRDVADAARLEALAATDVQPSRVG